MTTWTARRAKTGDTTRLLCGRMDRNEKYDCSGLVGYVVEGSTAVSPGLTDDETPGHYHWSKHALVRIARGGNPHASRQRPYRPTAEAVQAMLAAPPGIARTAAGLVEWIRAGKPGRVMTARFAWHTVSGSCVVPCDHVVRDGDGYRPDSHDNLVDLHD